MQSHYHRCKKCELMFGCFCDEEGRLFGRCPQCGGQHGGLTLLGALMILGAVIVWIWSAWN